MNNNEPISEEDALIEKTANLIHKYEMDIPAVIFLGTVKHTVFIGGQMGRFFLSPFTIILGDKSFQDSEKFFTVFEKQENIEKVIKILEDIAQKEEEVKRKEKEENKKLTSEESKKKGWRRYLPFAHAPSP